MTFPALLEVLITAPFGAVYMVMLTKGRYGLKQMMVSVYLFAVTNILINLVLSVLLPFELPRYISRSMFIFCGWIYSTLISEYRGFRTLFAFLTACTFYEIQSLLATIFILVSQNHSPYARFLCKTLAFLLIVELLYRFVRKPFLYILEVNEIDWRRFCLIPMALTVSFFLLDSYPSPLAERPQNIPAALSLCLAIILFDGMQFALFRQMQINFQTAKSVNDMKTQMFALQKQIKTAEANEKTLIIFQHDLRHVANALSACLANEEYAQAEALLSSMNTTIGEIRPTEVVYCANGIMNAVISMFVQSANATGIEVTVKVAFPENSGTNYEELSVVVANAMENAIHACQKISGGKTRAIRVTCAPSGQQLLLEIANTYEGEVQFDEEKGFPVSGEDGHGVGTQSIAAFADRYRGILLYKTEDGWFYLRLILPIQSKSPL